MIERYSVLAVQTANPIARTAAQLEENLARTIRLASRALAAYRFFGPPIRLLVLPEFALQGVPYRSVADLRRIAVELPGEAVARFCELAAKFDCFIVPGTLIEADAAYPGHVFNTAVVVGASGMVARYRKLNPGIPVEPYTSPADLGLAPDDLVSVVDLEIGRLGLAICFDNYFPEHWRELAFRGVDVVASPAATMHPYRTPGPDDLWRAICRVRCAENGVYGVFVNQGASAEAFPPFAWGGGTFVVDFMGRIRSEIDLDGEQLVYGEIDLAALRAHRAHRVANHFPTLVRTRPYPHLNRPTTLDRVTLTPERGLDDAERLELAEQARSALYGDPGGADPNWRGPNDA